MRAPSQLAAERRVREKSERVELRLYPDRPDDAAVLAWLDATRGDASRTEAVKTALLAAVKEAKGS